MRPELRQDKWEERTDLMDSPEIELAGFID